MKISIKNYRLHSEPKRLDPFSTVKTFCVNYFVNLNNIPYDTECNNSQLVYFKVLIGGTQKTYSSEKNETARNCWDEYRNFNIKLKKVFERKIEKEPIKYLEYPNQMNKIFYVRSKLWPPSCPIF